MPRIGVGEQSATTIALVIHELATNSLKYDSLSATAGLLDISGDTTNDDILTLRWIERGGPDVEAPPHPARTGFGSKLVERTLSQQLGGSILYEWPREGVIVRSTEIAMRSKTAQFKRETMPFEWLVSGRGQDKLNDRNGVVS